MLKRRCFFIFVIMLALFGCNNDEQPQEGLQLLQAFMGSTPLNIAGAITDNLPVDRSISLIFSVPINRTSATAGITLTTGGQVVATSISFSGQDKTAVIFPAAALSGSTTYKLSISNELQGAAGEDFSPVEINFKTIHPEFKIASLKIGEQDYLGSTPVKNISITPTFQISFSNAIAFDVNDATLITLKGSDGAHVPLTMTLTSDKIVSVNLASTERLKSLMKYELVLSSKIKDAEGISLTQLAKVFYTDIDPNPAIPKILNDEDSDLDNTNDLLSVVQHQTFKYFWDFGHPSSGMARERNTSGDVVTSGGSGFGIMALIVGMERNFISRDDGLARMKKIVSFLETSDRFHGAWPHWLNGSTGKVVPFSAKDDGGDLVETSFLVQGLITFRQYLKPAIAEEALLINRITALWEGVEWDWYRKDNAEVLYWHWSPTYTWDINFALSGYFEEQVTYFLAASSPTHGIPKSVYTNGYGKNGAIVKNNTYYNYTLPLESPAPLFWVQYSYLGLDPHFSDEFANYWQQNVNATLINQAYCIANPKGYIGYSDACWGLTASDNQNGYNAHSPSNDLGVITPTAALSSFPYAPEESMKALKFFYYTLGDRLWGEYGFYDAFNLTDGWTADSFLAIDQGPIIVMIENYRTGLLWDLFMSAPEVQNGETVLGYSN